LNLSATSVSDYVRSGFPYWQKLETLYLNYTNITSDLVLSFKELPQLIALKMTGCWNFLDDGFSFSFFFFSFSKFLNYFLFESKCLKKIHKYRIKVIV